MVVATPPTSPPPTKNRSPTLYPFVPSSAAVPDVVTVLIGPAPVDPVIDATVIVKSFAGVVPPKEVPNIFNSCPTL